MRELEDTKCVKIWSHGAAKPDGLFNKHECPDAPENWFREEPKLAAELFGLELGKTCKVYTQDEAGKIKVFQVVVSQQVNAVVED